MPDLIDVLIEAQTELDWCADPSELERAPIRLVDLEPRDDVAVPSAEDRAAEARARAGARDRSTNPSGRADRASRPVCRISLRAADTSPRSPGVARPDRAPS